MSQWMKTAALTVLVALLVVVGAGLVVIYTGAYNVASTAEHWGITRSALNTLQRNSVAARADDVTGSIPTDSAELAHGFEHFHEMCVVCHGAPGFDRGEFGQGMTPVPPRLEEVAGSWSDREIFWIIRHGIRLAGMPAFGPTHGDDAIWAIAGVVRQLEDMSAEEYGERVRALQEARGGEGGGEAGGGGHSHAPGTPAHGH